jgi:hypothetical protein
VTGKWRNLSGTQDLIFDLLVTSHWSPLVRAELSRCGHIPGFRIRGRFNARRSGSPHLGRRDSAPACRSSFWIRPRGRAVPAPLEIGIGHTQIIFQSASKIPFVHSGLQTMLARLHVFDVQRGYVKNDFPRPSKIRRAGSTCSMLSKTAPSSPAYARSVNFHPCR